MKNVSVKVLAGIGALSLAGAIFSFTSDNVHSEEPDSKKYEVIRMVNGEMVQFDTIVPSSSVYTPQDYLADLGFANDEHVAIIDVTNFDPEHMEMMHEMHMEGDSESMHDDQKMVFVEIEEESENGDHEVIIKKKCIKDGEEVEFEEGEGEHEIKIEKRVIVNENGEEDVEINVETMMENINIDSMIQVALALEGIEGDSGQMIMHKVIVIDEQVDGDGAENVQWTEVDTEGATYHKSVDGPNHHMEVAVWGDEHEDFTLVIVSDPSQTPPHKAPVVDKNSSIKEMKLYPNPTNTSSQLQLDFKDKAETAIIITDIQGKVVARLDLGKFKGQFTHDINVDKWEKGVYLVRVQHGDEEMIEKLIVE